MASNVLGGPLIECSLDPVTGFFRNGKCDTCGEDAGMHTVCACLTEPFLSFSASRGNNLVKPAPQFEFPGLKPGDYWCLCLFRWVEAHRHGVAPPIKLEATHASVLEFVSLEVLKEYAVEAGQG